MNLRHTIAIASLLVLAATPAMAKTFLIHITTGPDNPTEAALGFTVAAAAQTAGNTVNVFLAGDGASLITDADLAGKSAEFAMPKNLVELAGAADVVLHY